MKLETTHKLTSIFCGIAVLASCTSIVVALQPRSTQRVRPVKQVFEYNSVELIPWFDSSVTMLPQPDGAIVLIFDPPVAMVTAEWHDDAGTFGCCTPGGNCCEVDEAGSPGLYFGGVGKGNLDDGLVAVCTFEGGDDFSIFRIIED